MRVPRIRTTTSWGVALSLSLTLPVTSIARAPQEKPVPAPAVLDKLWQSDVDAKGNTQLAAGSSAVIVADDTLGVRAVSVEGRPLWFARHPTSHPIAAGGDLVVVYSEESLRALDQTTGEERWSTAVDPPEAGAAILEGGVFAATGLVLRAWGHDGTPRWQQGLSAPAVTPIAADAGRLYMALADSTLIAVNGDGRILWQIALDSVPKLLLASRGRIYFGAADGAVYAYDQDGSADWAWRYPVRSEAVGAPAIDDRCVYVALMDNSLRAFKRGSGNLCWAATQLNLRPASGPVVAGDGVVVTTVTGALVAVQKTTGRPLGEPVPAPGAGPGRLPPRLLSAVAAPGGAAIYTLTISASPTLAAFRRAVK